MPLKSHINTLGTDNTWPRGGQLNLTMQLVLVLKERRRKKTFSLLFFFGTVRYSAHVCNIIAQFQELRKNTALPENRASRRTFTRGAPLPVPAEEDLNQINASEHVTRHFPNRFSPNNLFSFLLVQRNLRKQMKIS